MVQLLYSIGAMCSVNVTTAGRSSGLLLHAATSIAMVAAKANFMKPERANVEILVLSEINIIYAVSEVQRMQTLTPCCCNIGLKFVFAKLNLAVCSQIGKS